MLRRAELDTDGLQAATTDTKRGAPGKQGNPFAGTFGTLEASSFVMELSKSAAKYSHKGRKTKEAYPGIFEVPSNIDPEVRMAMLGKDRQQVIDEMSVKDILDKNPIQGADGQRKKRSQFDREKLMSYVTVVLQLVIKPRRETMPLF